MIHFSPCYNQMPDIRQLTAWSVELKWSTELTEQMIGKYGFQHTQHRTKCHALWALPPSSWGTLEVFSSFTTIHLVGIVFFLAFISLESENAKSRGKLCTAITTFATNYRVLPIDLYTALTTNTQTPWPTQHHVWSQSNPNSTLLPVNF